MGLCLYWRPQYSSLAALAVPTTPQATEAWVQVSVTHRRIAAQVRDIIQYLASAWHICAHPRYAAQQMTCWHHACGPVRLIVPVADHDECC
jgi:hypothetical protein